MTVDLENTGLMRLDRGAMQHWSDLREFGAPASSAMRAVVGRLGVESARVLVVGPIAMDLVTEIRDVAAHLTMVNRSIPDSARYAEAFVNAQNVDIVCGDLLNLAQELGEFDVVLCLEDVSKVPSLEGTTVSWQATFDAVTSHVAENGRYAVVVENELGLHRITSLRSRYTMNDNSSWDVISTFDETRPRTIEQLAERAHVPAAAIGSLLPTWDDHAVLGWNLQDGNENFRTIANALVLQSPAFRQLGADPSRVTRAAVMADRLLDMPSGWLVVSGLEADHQPTLEVSRPSGDVYVYRLDSGVTRDDAGADMETPQGAQLFGELTLDACAGGDAAIFRALVQSWWQWAQSQAEEGRLAPQVADLRFDNLLRGNDETYMPVARAADEAELVDAAWRAVVDFVSVLRARGARHLWPAAMDDRTMAATIGAMAEMPPCVNLNSLIELRTTQLDLPAFDVPGLLAVVERLEETNEALASRATWFENRLSQRERELRQRAARQAAELAHAGRQQEVLRRSAEDLRRSVTYRLGNVAMGPLKKAKKRLGG